MKATQVRRQARHRRVRRVTVTAIVQVLPHRQMIKTIIRQERQYSQQENSNTKHIIFECVLNTERLRHEQKKSKQ